MMMKMPSPLQQDLPFFKQKSGAQIQFFSPPKIGLSRRMWRLSLIYGLAHPLVETVSRGKAVEVRVLSKSEVFSVKKMQ